MPTPQPIPEAFHELLARPVLMSLATTLADGTIQLTPVWFNFDGTYIYFNSERIVSNIASFVADPRSR